MRAPAYLVHAASCHSQRTWLLTWLLLQFLPQFAHSGTCHKVSPCGTASWCQTLLFSSIWICPATSWSESTVWFHTTCELVATCRFAILGGAYQHCPSWAGCTGLTRRRSQTSYSASLLLASDPHLMHMLHKDQSVPTQLISHESLQPDFPACIAG